MSYFSYKVRSFFQNISSFISLKYYSFKEELRYEQNLFEIRKEYNSLLKDMFFSKLFKVSVTALGGFALIGFLLIEGGSFLLGKVQKGIASVQVVEANIAPIETAIQKAILEKKEPELIVVAKIVKPIGMKKSAKVNLPAIKQSEVLQKKVVVIKDTLPKNLPITVPPEERYIILIDKGEKSLKLAEFLNGKYFIIEEFSVSIGRVMGDKKIEGDLKTPEGKYKILQVKTDDQLHSQYGPFAFVLNYPNKRDKSLGKTGSGIWIHGSGSNTRSPETKGCIELGNADLLQLRNYIHVATPVYIFPSDFIGINDEHIELAAIVSLKKYLNTF